MKKRATKIVIAAIFYLLALLIDFSKIDAINKMVEFDITWINKAIFIISYLV